SLPRSRRASRRSEALREIRAAARARGGARSLPARTPSAAEQALRVARERIDFEVDAVAGAQTLERGHGEGGRNQVDLELGAAHGVDGQAHAIDGDRSLAREVARERPGRAHPEETIAPAPLDLRHLADPVDMAEHQVPV